MSSQRFGGGHLGGGAVAAPAPPAIWRGRQPASVYLKRRIGALGLTVMLLTAIAFTVTQIVNVVRDTAQTRQSVVDQPSIADVVSQSLRSDGRNGAPLALAAGRPLFPLAKGEPIVVDEKAPFLAQGLQVQSTVGGSGAWLGVSGEQRVFVQMPDSLRNSGSLTADELHSGDTVSVTGAFDTLPFDLNAIGITGGNAELLQSQERLIVANSVLRPDDSSAETTEKRAS